MRFALAVSGGGDSLALMHLVAAWTAKRRVKPPVLTVDHGLQKQSATNAHRVATWARAVGLEGVVLRVARKDIPQTNIEDAAREARYRLMGDWCRTHNIAALLLAHTRDEDRKSTRLNSSH